MPPSRTITSSNRADGGKPNGQAAQASLLRQLNTRQVLAALQRHGPLSRAEIARHTGISGPTITRTVVDLLAEQLVEEGEFAPPTNGKSSLGRPGKSLRLASEAVAVQGVVIGVSQCELVSAGLDGALQSEPIVFATPRRYGDLVRRIAEQLHKHRAGSDANVLGVGVSIPGLLRREDRRTLVSPNLHQTDGQQLGVDVAEKLESLGLANEVVLLQEMQALCLGERMYGAARDVKDFAMVDIADGLGLGVMHGGEFITGSNGFAGELGHITVEINGKKCGCGNRGCLETVATDAALAAAISARQGTQRMLDEWLPRIRSGGIDARRELEEWLEFLAVGLAAVINLFNPSRLFVHGRGLDAAPDLFARLIERTASRALSPSLAGCQLIRARGSKRQGAVAAIIERLTRGE